MDPSKVAPGQTMAEQVEATLLELSNWRSGYHIAVGKKESPPPRTENPSLNRQQRRALRAMMKREK